LTDPDFFKNTSRGSTTIWGGKNNLKKDIELILETSRHTTFRTGNRTRRRQKAKDGGLTKH
jgi:hypothetical protein